MVLVISQLASSIALAPSLASFHITVLTIHRYPVGTYCFSSRQQNLSCFLTFIFYFILGRFATSRSLENNIDIPQNSIQNYVDSMYIYFILRIAENWWGEIVYKKRILLSGGKFVDENIENVMVMVWN